MKTYRGYSDAERGDGTGPAMVVVVDDRGARPLKHEMRHSPDGFSWGFSGSGVNDHRYLPGADQQTLPAA